jgi:hypothetical protein
LHLWFLENGCQGKQPTVWSSYTYLVVASMYTDTSPLFTVRMNLLGSCISIPASDRQIRGEQSFWSAVMPITHQHHHRHPRGLSCRNVSLSRYTTHAGCCRFIRTRNFTYFSGCMLLIPVTKMQIPQHLDGLQSHSLCQASIQQTTNRRVSAMVFR